MTAGIILLTIASFGAAVGAYMLARQQTNQWFRCPSCRQYHQGNQTLTALPPDTDGTVFPRVCRECSCHYEFKEDA